MPTENVMTQDSYNKLKRERDELISQRPEIAERLKEARAFGDLSENAEYDVAKEEQAKLEERILRLSERLRTAIIIKDEDLTLDHVSLGLTVKVKETRGKVTESYSIVDATEIDPFSDPIKVSVESSVGKALVGSKVGDKVEVVVPGGKPIRLEILEITRTV
ncbi:MAG: transcription elongation factor GreA [Firmicutes bacterium]|nr:transcription elongation factor GreA [Bacillota bacterium]